MFKLRWLHNNTNRFSFSVDDGVAIVVVVFGPIVVVIVVVVGRSVGIDVDEKLRWSGQNFPEVGQKAGVVLLEAEAAQIMKTFKNSFKARNEIVNKLK